MTGGGRGFCGPTGAGRAFGIRRWLAPPPRFGRGGFLRGAYGRGRGLGLGRFMYGAAQGATYPPATGFDEPMSAAEERDALQQQLSAIEEHLAQIHERLRATGE
jgi:hypothetical protein